MGKSQTSFKPSSSWSILGLKTTGGAGINFKRKLLNEMEKRKNIQRGMKKVVVEESKRSKMMALPTGYRQIDETSPDAINRHLYLTPNMAWSNMMTDKELTAVNSYVERTLGTFRQGSMIESASRLFAAMDAFYTCSNDATTHFIACMDNDVMKVMFFKASQFLLDADKRSLRVFLDEEDTNTGERFVSFETSIDPCKGGDVGKDLLAFVKLVNFTTQVMGITSSYVAERVRYNVSLENVIKNVHDVEGITFSEISKRNKRPAPFTGKRFIAVNQIKPLYQTIEKEGEERIVFELLINLPPIESTRRFEVQDQVKNSHRINSVVQYYPNSN